MRLTLFLWLLVSIFSCKNANNEINVTVSKIQPLDSKVGEKKDTVTIIGVGDIMPGTDFPSTEYLAPNDDAKAMFADVADLLRNADATFGNLEGCYLDGGEVVKKCDNPALCYAFRSPTRYFEAVVDAGFDMFSLSNNHIGDFGDSGRNSTMQLIDKAGLVHAGLLTHPVGIFEKDGIKYGLCAFSPINGTCRIEAEYYAEAIGIVSELNKQCDIVIVSMHGGGEGNSKEHITKQTEIFYDEDRGNVYEFARKMIDAGGDIVFGHGPHVTRAVDIYNNRFIAYSLGNFCTYGRFVVSGASGIAPIVKVYTTSNGEFIKAEVTSIYQTKTHGPKIDPQNAAWKRMVELTQHDLPEAPITFNNNVIEKK